MKGERKTNLTLFGRLTADPLLVQRSEGQKLLCEFSVCYQPNKLYPAVFIDLIAYDRQVCEYVAGTFKKGDEVHILNSTPVLRKGADGRKYIKWVAWDVALKGLSEGSVSPDGEDTFNEPPW